ncbi:WD40 repeat-like protein [Cylindrobasidium torrendii FP15055 ss-10]|uniref:WD40 repeat-like protein n=1 Tax=Cylindrobasidium torrendii FP15055 ss-10 TaxID=1314674 RepID=A0A0D7B745_9AGAR|nr:WD40 repeat-like protein [Cylindrobasidium torrendii FP15055 ss-10]
MSKNAMPFVLHKSLNGYHTLCVNSLAFSPNGLYFASAGRDGQVLVFSTHTGTLVKKYTASSPPQSLTWDINGAMIYVGLASGEIVLLKVMEGNFFSRQWYKLIAHVGFMSSSIEGIHVAALNGVVRAIAQHPDTKQLIVAHGERVSVFTRVTQVNFEIVPGCDAIQVPVPVCQAENFVFSARPKPVSVHALAGKNEFVVADEERGYGGFRISATGPTCIWTTRERQRIGLSAISTDRTTMASWNLWNGVDVWDLQNVIGVKGHIEVPNNFVNGRSLPLDLAFIDNDHVLLASNVGSPAVLNVTRRAVVQTLDHCNRIEKVPICAAARVGDRSVVVTADRERTTDTQIKIWMARSGRRGFFYAVLQWIFQWIFHSFQFVAFTLLMMMAAVYLDRQFRIHQGIALEKVLQMLRGWWTYIQAVIWHTQTTDKMMVQSRRFFGIL